MQFRPRSPVSYIQNWGGEHVHTRIGVAYTAPVEAYYFYYISIFSYIMYMYVLNKSSSKFGETDLAEADLPTCLHMTGGGRGRPLPVIYRFCELFPPLFLDLYFVPLWFLSLFVSDASNTNKNTNSKITILVTSIVLLLFVFFVPLVPATRKWQRSSVHWTSKLSWICNYLDEKKMKGIYSILHFFTTEQSSFFDSRMKLVMKQDQNGLDRSASWSGFQEVKG